MPSDAMPCATQDLVQLATRCAATSLPWGFGIAKLFCDILVTVRAVQCKQVVCDDLCIFMCIYLLINSLTQRGHQTFVQCHCSVAIPGIGFFVSSLQTPQRDGALKSLHEYCTSFMLGRDRSLKTLTSIAT